MPDESKLPLRYDGEVKWVPVKTAASMLRVTMKRVYQLIGTGSLSAVRVDRTWLVSCRSINARIELLRSEEVRNVA